MYPRFVKTSNVARFLGAIEGCHQRGAPEASWVLATGDAGHGKSRTALKWAHDSEAVHVRIKAPTTPRWLLQDIALELGCKDPARSCERLFNQVFELLARRPRPIVLDEVENALHRDIACLEVVRDLSDLLEIMVVLVGREWVPARLTRHRQIWSRISAAAAFAPLEVADVRLCRTELCEVEADEAVDEEIARQSRGYVREVMNAIANVERIGKRKKSPVTMDDVKGRALTQDIQFGRRRP